MIAIGKWNSLEVISQSEIGLTLEGAEYGQILLPKRYIPEGTKVGEILDVFLYCDSEDRLIATTEKPIAEAGQFARLKVVDTTSIGAFLDWGLPKDLMVPFREQREKMHRGEWHLVYVYVDPASERIVGSSRLNRFLQKEAPPTLKTGQEVSLIMAYETEMGWNAIIEEICFGLLFKNEVFGKYKPGDRIKGFIKQIRPDGKVDLSIRKPIAETVESLEQFILDKLEEKDGFLPFTDKSPPEVIYEVFSTSKKNFKKAIGVLYKKRKITLESIGIRLVKE